MQKFYELTKELSWDRSISDSQWVLVGAVGKVWLSPKRVEVLYASKDGYSHDCSQIALEDVASVLDYLAIGTVKAYRNALSELRRVIERRTR